MTDIKWIKVTVDMFEDSKIEFLRSLPEGDSVIVIWLQLLSLAGKSNADGYLLITDGIPYTEQVLSNTLRRNPVLLQYALETFLKLKMINVEDGPFHITKWEKHQSAMRMEEIKSKSALKQAAYRERQKEKQLLLTESNRKVTETVTCYVTKSNSYQTDIELDLELEKDTTLRDDFDKVKNAYELIHAVPEMPYTNSLILHRLLDDGFTSDVIIGIMREKHRPSVRTLKFYEGAIRETAETTSARRSTGSGKAAYYQPVPKHDVELNYRRREIALNKWIQNGGNPDEFEYGSA